jgi:hypothetical protein
VALEAVERREGGGVDVVALSRDAGAASRDHAREGAEAHEVEGGRWVGEACGRGGGEEVVVRLARAQRAVDEDAGGGGLHRSPPSAIARASSSKPCLR